jgi:hypothetical protein
MAGPGVYADEDWRVPFLGFLEPCNELEAVGWHHPVVVVGGGGQGGGIANPVSDVVIGRVSIERLEFLRLLR